MPKVNYLNWVIGISQSSCLRCQLLVRAIRKLAPHFLEIESSTAAEMNIIVGEHGRFIIYTTPRIGAIDIQLFSTHGMPFWICLIAFRIAYHFQETAL